MISELSWSLLDPKPLMVYNKKFDAHICCWNGVLMTRTYALIVVAYQWNNIMPSQAISHAAWKEFVKLYSLGVFGDVDWDHYIEQTQYNTHHTYLIRQLNADNANFVNLKKQYTAPQALSWFMNTRQIVIGDTCQTL